jgi:Domain of Unknown Function (DUF928)
MLGSKEKQVRSMLQRLMIFSLLLGFILGSLPPLAQAQPPKRPTRNRIYKPRKGNAPKGPITTTATRGCDFEEKSQGSFVALAPVSNVGQTQSARPTFAWFMPHKEAKALRFELINITNRPGKTVYAADLNSQPGIMQFTLPASAPGLAIGQSYHWRVILQCEPGRPSADQLVSAEIELTTGDATPSTTQAYAERGLWYDAFALASAPERMQLLSDLANLEAEAPIDKTIQQSKAIEEINTPP